MRKNLNVELNYKDSEVLFVNTSLPWNVQPPTFATVAEAYAYFTRHPDDFAVPDYSDDSDDLPDFVSSAAVDDFFVDGPPQQVLDGVAPPAESDDDGQRAAEERESEPASE